MRIASCVASWHILEMLLGLKKSGRHLLVLSVSEFDPTRASWLNKFAVTVMVAMSESFGDYDRVHDSRKPGSRSAQPISRRNPNYLRSTLKPWLRKSSRL